MTPCSICRHPTPERALVRYPYVYAQTLALTIKINPGWTRQDGMCRTCIESIINTVAEIEEAKAEQRPSSTNFSEYYRYSLTKREHGQWHHCNPDMVRWRQRQIVERIGDEAISAGYDSWLVFDPDEKMLAQGVVTDADLST